jgi:hypothetical protein
MWRQSYEKFKAIIMKFKGIYPTIKYTTMAFSAVCSSAGYLVVRDQNPVQFVPKSLVPEHCTIETTGLT